MSDFWTPDNIAVLLMGSVIALWMFGIMAYIHYTDQQHRRITDELARSRFRAEQMRDEVRAVRELMQEVANGNGNDPVGVPRYRRRLAFRPTDSETDNGGADPAQRGGDAA